MRSISTILLVFSVFIMMTGHTQETDLVPGRTTSFSIQKNDYNQLAFKNTFTTVHGFVVKHTSGIYNRLQSERYGTSLEVGNPQLPVLKEIIEVPVGAMVDIKTLHKEYLEFDLYQLGIQHPLFPVQPPVSKSIDNPEDLPFEKNEAVYQTDSYYGFEPVQVKMLGTMRGVNLARLEIAPVEYNPVQHTIRVCVDMEVEITFLGGDKTQTVNQKRKFFSPYFEGVYKQVANYKPEMSDELILDEPVTYIIVSDPMFETALQPFIEWKTKKGFNVVEAYTNDPGVGTSTTTIKSYLQGFYNSPPAGFNSQSFVLFVGDVAQIPTFSGTAGGHYSDLYYCDYTGDIYPECYYGRFSAENLTELQPQIDKTLEYEQYLMPDPSFLDEVVMVTGDDASHELTWGNGQINYGTTYYFNLSHGITSHTYLQDEPAGGNYSANIRQNVSDGVAYGNYSAHCSSSGWADPSFISSHISALTNAHKYPLLVGNCCLSNKFDVNDCFGEILLKTADKGALGYIGGSNSTYWDEDYWWGVGYETVSADPVYHAANLGAYDRTFHDQGEPLTEWYNTQGQMPSAGNLAVTQAGSSLETYYWEIYHLMGDPSLMVYFTQPPVTTANYNALMPLGSTNFTVNTQPYAYVAISKNGVLHGAAVSDASGLANVVLDPITVPGIADVVITRQNGQPYIGTVTVASPSGPYLILESYLIDDNSGNGNGEADYEETILLDVSLENLGSSTATNVSATLMTSDPNVLISDDSSLWPDIPSGSVSAQSGAFEMGIANNVVDQHIVDFDLIATDGFEIWNSQMSITVNAPLLLAGNLTIDDAVGEMEMAVLMQEKQQILLFKQ
ncbi:MAG: C25 family cysteine peptidase [Bacteroidales bacterium]